MEEGSRPVESGWVIAIDGPAAAGKSTVALEVARALGCRLIDSGAMYRAVTLVAIECGARVDDFDSLAALAGEVAACYRVVEVTGRAPSVFLGEREVTGEIRTPSVGELVSPVSAVPAVRRELVDLQRSMSAGGDIVVEGRDIGTVVFPDADLKVFLDASPAERAQRRLLELDGKGLDVTAGQVEGEIDMRDRMDSSRESSPLLLAPDAIPIDTTGKTVQQVVDRIVEAARGRGIWPRGVD